jgi:hypothetical protein
MSVTETAHELIRGERGKHYGPPHHNFEVIAKLWDAYIRPTVNTTLKNNGVDPEEVFVGVLVDPNDVCNMMTLLKIAREATGQGYHEDSTVDAIGYQAIKEVLQTPVDKFLKEMK